MAGFSGHMSGGGGVGGGGSAEVVDRLPLNDPPASAHSLDDSFTGSSLDGKWTSPANSASGMETTVAVADGHVVMEPTTAGTSSTGLVGGWGIRQAAPSGDFRVSACLQSRLGGTGDVRSGIFLGRLSNRGIVFGYGNTNDRIEIIDFTSYSRTVAWGTWGGVINTFASFVAAGVYWIRVTYEDTTNTVDVEYSSDGLAWVSLDTGQALGGAPDDVGLALWSNSANMSADYRLRCHWFRVEEL